MINCRENKFKKENLILQENISSSKSQKTNKQTNKTDQTFASKRLDVVDFSRHFDSNTTKFAL